MPNIHWSLWHSITAAIALFAILPILTLSQYASLSIPLGDIIYPLTQSLRLCIQVCILSTGLGISLAWLITHYDLPYKRLFNTLLMLPLAVPSYIYAFIFLGMISYSSPISSFFRHYFDLQIPSIQHLNGLSIIMSLSLYPYIYTFAKNAFQAQGPTPLEIAQSLGYSKFQAFRFLLLPMARPWISQGFILVALDTLADFGAVSIFNINTLTTRIYITWFNHFSFDDAVGLSFILISLSIFLRIVYFMLSKRQIKQLPTTGKSMSYPLNIWQKITALFFLGTITSIAVIAPTIQLIIWSISTFTPKTLIHLLPNVSSSIIIALLSTLIIIIIAILLAVSERFTKKHPLQQMLANIALSGYAIPGTILGVAAVATFNHTWGIGILIIGLSLRFLPICTQIIATSLARIPNDIDNSAASLGASETDIITRIHLPLLKRSMISGALLTSIDILKELPISLICRPYGWNTLSIAIFSFTEEGLWEHAALPALLLCIISAIPVWFFKHQEEHTI